MAGGLLCGVLVGATGCEAGPVFGTMPGLGVPVAVAGEHGDIHAAVRFAAHANDFAVVSRTLDEETGVLRYELTSIRDEPAWIEIAGVEGGAGAGVESGQLTLAVRVGRVVAAPVLEQAIIDDLTKRLGVLLEGPERIDWEAELGDE